MMPVVHDATLDTGGWLITFYSYKGGTGRTMALANLACLFAREESPRRVLAIDWDLEAPGLHYYFRTPDQRTTELNSSGVVEYFTRVSELVANGDNLAGDEDARADGILDQISLEAFCRSTGISNIDLMPAGRLDATYQSRLAELDWRAIYARAPAVFRSFARKLRKDYDVVLVDSRTGMTDIGGICTSLLPDTLVVVFSANRQSLMGIERLVCSSVEYRQNSRDVRPLLVYPLPSRIDAERDKQRRKWRHGDSTTAIEGYQVQFERIFRLAYARESCDLSAYFDEVQVQHSPDYAYGEEVAALDAPETDRFSIVRSYQALLRWIVSSAAPWERLEDVQARTRLAALLRAEARALEQERSADVSALFDMQDEIVRASIEQLGIGNINTITAVDRLVRTRLRAGADVSRCVVVLNDLVAALSDMSAGARLKAIGVILAATAALRAQGQTEQADLMMARAIAAADAAAVQFGASALEILEVTARELRETFSMIEALALQQRVVERRARHDGDEGLAALRSMHELADTMRESGDLDGARSLHERVLRMRREQLGPEHPDTVDSMESVAQLVRDQGNADEARALQEEVVELRRRSRGDTHPEVLRSYANLASVHLAQGDLSTARLLLERVLDGFRHLLGEDDPTTLWAMNNLAETLRAQGDVTKARELQDRVLTARARLSEQPGESSI